MLKRKGRIYLWSFAYLLVLLSFITPVMVLTVSFTLVPMLYLYVKLGWKRFAIHALVIHLIVFLLVWKFAVIIFAVSAFFMIPTIVMGNLYRRGAGARTVVTAGIVTMIAELLLALLISTTMGFDLNETMKNSVHDTLDLMPESLRDQISNSMVDDLIDIAIQMIPLYMIGAAFYFVSIGHTLSRRLLNATGERILSMPPVREWRLPKSLVWYYLIAIVLELFVNLKSNSLLTSVMINMYPLLMVAFSIQAIGLMFYIAYVKRWNLALPIVSIVLLVFIPPLMNLLSIVGVFDVAFPIRERLNKH